MLSDSNRSINLLIDVDKSQVYTKRNKRYNIEDLTALRTGCWQLYIIKNETKGVLHFRPIVQNLKENNVVENQAVIQFAKINYE